MSRKDRKVGKKLRCKAHFLMPYQAIGCKQHSSDKRYHPVFTCFFFCLPKRRPKAEECKQVQGCQEDNLLCVKPERFNIGPAGGLCDLNLVKKRIERVLVQQGVHHKVRE